MKHIILGTAGHVDHGKTSLVKALTGVDTDRLKEEKERGITIELGFASLPLTSGGTLGVVDVPGHEKFVKNMVAGATGIDLVLLVIAADEGVMPQTVEHLDICTLLGIRNGIIALTKIDLVDADWLALVQDDVRQFLQTTFLDGAPIVPVSVVSGRGIAELRDAIEASALRIGERADSGLFRIPVDRVFTMKGFGSVVTGTLVSGSVRVATPSRSSPSASRPRSAASRCTTSRRSAPRPGSAPPSTCRASSAPRSAAATWWPTPASSSPRSGSTSTWSISRGPGGC